MGENEDVITLLDEEGVEHEFSIVDVLEVSERRYAILQPLEAGEEPDTAVIFRMEGDALVTIEDDDEFERVRLAFEADADAGLSSPTEGDGPAGDNGSGEVERSPGNGDGDLPSGNHHTTSSH